MASPVTTHEGISFTESSSTPYIPNSVPISPGSPEPVAPGFLNKIERLEIAEVEEQDEVQIAEVKEQDEVQIIEEGQDEVKIIGKVKLGHRDWNRNWRNRRIKIEGEARGKNKDRRRSRK